MIYLALLLIQLGIFMAHKSKLTVIDYERLAKLVSRAVAKDLREQGIFAVDRGPSSQIRSPSTTPSVSEIEIDERVIPMVIKSRPVESNTENMTSVEKQVDEKVLSSLARLKELKEK